MSGNAIIVAPIAQPVVTSLHSLYVAMGTNAIGPTSIDKIPATVIAYASESGTRDVEQCDDVDRLVMFFSYG